MTFSARQQEPDATPSRPGDAGGRPVSRCIPLDDADGWRAALKGIPHAFSHTWESCHALSLSRSSRPFLYTFGGGAVRIVCPLAEREFAGYRDVVTPSGISGFTGVGDCPEFPRWWREFVAERQYVCGYIGLHPLFENPTWFSDATSDNSVYLLDLTLDADELVRRVDRNRRRELRDRERRTGALIHDRGRLADFLLREHEPFLRRAGARSTYSLSNETLARLCSLDNVLLVGVGAPEVEEVYAFTYTKYVADCFLNVSRPEGCRYTTALLWHGVERLKEMSVPALNLGGGIREDDDLARSKQRWGSRRLPLRSLKQVYRPDVYEALCRQSGADPDRFFPPYHAPPPGPRDVTDPSTRLR